jgi:hypothetical protein
MSGEQPGRSLDRMLVAPDWDRDAELAKINRALPEADRVIAEQWVWLTDLRYAGAEYAEAKTDAERLKGKSVVSERARGEKSATVAEDWAIAHDPEVFYSRLRYRLAEQRVVVCKEALKILHAKLIQLNVEAADARAAGAAERRNP